MNLVIFITFIRMTVILDLDDMVTCIQDTDFRMHIFRGNNV